MHVNSFNHESLDIFVNMYLRLFPFVSSQSRVSVLDKRKCRIHQSVPVTPATAER